MLDISRKYESAAEAKESDLPAAVVERLRDNESLSERHRRNLSVLFSR